MGSRCSEVDAETSVGHATKVGALPRVFDNRKDFISTCGAVGPSVLLCSSPRPLHDLVASTLSLSTDLTMVAQAFRQY
jgi:hypothetical protein